LSNEFNVEVQKLFLDFMLDDAEKFVRVQNIFDVANFDKAIKPVAEFLLDHATKYKTIPDKTQVKAVCGYEPNDVSSLADGHTEWFLAEFEKFSRQKALERAILKSADLLEKGTFEPVEKLIKDAVQISLVKDMGTDYFENPRERLEHLKQRTGVSTGWSELDRLLYGGFNRGDLQIFAGGSGSGKSLIMQNLSVNWSVAGLNGIYVTLELSEELCSMRLDSMFTETATTGILSKIDDIELKVSMLRRRCGALRVKYMPAQSNVNDIRAYVRELQIQTGMKPDFVCVDYLDLLMPVTAKVSPNDLFVKDKYVSEELRNLSKELGVILVSASQLNRSAVEEVEFDHSHISGGISKINTADNVFGIFVSRHMREQGRYQIQAMKTRSSNGVGKKIDLAFDNDTLRIFDMPEGAMSPTAQKSTDILKGIKSSSTTKPKRTDEIVDPETGEIVKKPADEQSNKLKQLLSNIKTSN